jgi:hypothetical protein
LKLDGIGLLTSYENGKLLGDPKYAPVMDELNRRKAIIFVHPTATCCSDPIPPLNESIIEFPNGHDADDRCHRGWIEPRGPPGAGSPRHPARKGSYASAAFEKVRSVVAAARF